MSEYVVTDTELTAVADAIREKGGTSADLEWNADFISAIEAISGGGGGVGIILDVEQKQGAGLPALTLDETVTIPETGDYHIFAGGFTGNVSVKINDVSQSLTFSANDYYSFFYNQDAITLNQGDVVKIYMSSSGRTYERALIFKEASGGGAKNILKGTDAPSASLGSNGDIYLQHSIPSDYRPVEYLTTDASALTYARIPMLVKAGDVYEYSASRESWGSGYYVIFGVKTSITQDSGDRIANGLYTNKKRIFADTGRIHATEDPTKTAGQSVVYGDTITSGKFTQSITVDSFSNAKYYLFYGGYASNSISPSTNMGRATLKRSNGNPFIDLIPCVRKSDSVCGFYDVVSDTFYTAVSGSFTAPSETFAYDDVVKTYCKVNGAWQALEGTDIDDVNTEGDTGILSGDTEPSASLGSDGDLYVQLMDLPTNVNFVEYLQSSGTQYIDTGIIADQNTSYMIDYENITPAWRFGARQNAQSRSLMVTPSSSSATNSEYVDYGTSRYTAGSLASRRKIKIKNGVLYIDDVIKSRYSVQTFTTPSSLLIFAVHQESTVQNSGSTRFYRVVIWQDDVLIADYLPCLDTNDVPCMWDNIAKEYVYNDGTGDFTYGSAVTPEKISDVLYEKKNGTWVVV